MTLRNKLVKKGFWFFIFNTFFLLLIASRYFKYYYDLDSFITVFYLSIVTVSHFTAFSLLLFTLYTFIIIIFPNRNVAWVSAAVISSICSLILLLDTVVFDLYRMHINKFVLELVFGGAGNQIFVFHANQYVLSIVVILISLSIMLFASYRFFRWEKVLKFTKEFLIVASGRILKTKPTGIG